MGHEAFGIWFTEELRADTLKIDNLLGTIRAIENRSLFDAAFNAMGLQLSLNREDAEIAPMFESFDDLPEDTDLSENDTNAQCGLADLKAALLTWQMFVSVNEHSA